MITLVLKVKVADEDVLFPAHNVQYNSITTIFFYFDKMNSLNVCISSYQIQSLFFVLFCHHNACLSASLHVNDVERAAASSMFYACSSKIHIVYC